MVVTERVRESLTMRLLVRKSGSDRERGVEIGRERWRESDRIREKGRRKNGRMILREREIGQGKTSKRAERSRKRT